MLSSQAAKDVTNSEMLADIFSRIEKFFKRLEMYAEVPLPETTTSIVVEIMVEVVVILQLMTKEIKQN